MQMGDRALFKGIWLAAWALGLGVGCTREVEPELYLDPYQGYTRFAQLGEPCGSMRCASGLACFNQRCHPDICTQADDPDGWCEARTPEKPVCSLGQCVQAARPLPIIGQACDAQLPCPAPLRCAKGKCQQLCQDSADCAIDRLCIKGGLDDVASCQARTGCGAQAGSLAQHEYCRAALIGAAPMGLACAQDRCVQYSDAASKNCADNSWCAAGYLCEAGRCVERCASDLDCPEGAQCLRSPTTPDGQETTCQMP